MGKIAGFSLVLNERQCPKGREFDLIVACNSKKSCTKSIDFKISKSLYEVSVELQAFTLVLTSVFPTYYPQELDGGLDCLICQTE